MSESIQGMIDTTIDKIRAVVDAEIVVGKTITVGDISVVPVSKVSFGVGGGGSDIPSKKTGKTVFGGGTGVGVSIAPTAFLVFQNGRVKVIPVTAPATAFDNIDKAIELVPEMVDKVTGIVKERKEKKRSEENGGE